MRAGRLPVEALAEAAERVASTGNLREALGAVAAAAAEALDADLVVLRLLNEQGELVARAVAPESSALAAEAAGTRADCDLIAAGVASEPVRRAAAGAQASATIAVAARAGGRVVGSLEAVRHEPFGADEASLAALAAAQVALAVRTLAPGTHAAAGFRRAAWLELAGDALAAGGDPRRSAQQALRVAADASGARGGVVWRVAPDGGLTFMTSLGEVEAVLPRLATLAESSLEAWRPASVATQAGLPPALACVAIFPLGQPPFGVLQLLYSQEDAPGEEELSGLAAFAARAAHAVRSGERARSTEQELERTRALLDVVSEAIARLSLAHTLETAVERISDLLQFERVGVFLRDHGRLYGAAGRGLAPEHDAVAQRLADVFLGPLRARTSVHAHADGRETALGAVRTALAGVGEASAVGVPLQVREESIGLLVAFPDERTLSENDLALLTALAAQLAVVVQNARLHERETKLGVALSDSLDAERQASRQVAALYEISRSFAQTLSLDRTLDAVIDTLVQQFGVDAAVIRVPDDRGDQFVPARIQVSDDRLTAPLRTILARPQPRPPRMQEAMLLDGPAAARLGGAHALLRPFLEAGSTAALLQLASPTELLAELTIVSLDPAEPITEETLATARTIAQQAALAVDNARLYQQQKAFAETMQRSLLPRERPSVPGLEVGRVYESAAQVDVGGDVYDFLELGDGRLAVVLGDVTGHGIDATADMAMAKFVFRSLAGEHPDPSAFLARANDVVVREIATGKFITMVYVTVDGDGNVLCASAGHPEPRVVTVDGNVSALACGGLALGILAPEAYEQVSTQLPPGGSAVLYTDGVIESRREGELFGVERLDEVLAANASLSAQVIADAVLAACRDFAGGDLPDDCAVVVIRRL
ncbi:MAG TPA: GAF domain-containing SpoIIE family protein phosphatase [Gaiellaceae bacterium]|nr:GAF domain-containing SpoIIE family protein phosphatase [Gaiellaceae bacterium]